MTYPTIEMYDISCTTTRAPWSPFTARTYLALRVLDMPFHRTMVPMVGIRSLLSSAGVSPNSDGDLLLPAITLTSDGSTRWLTESDDIAAHLQELFVAAGNPVSKSLFPDEDAREAGKAARKALRESLYSADHAWKSLIPAVLDILEPESQQWFVDTRTKSWGKHPREILTQDAPLNEERAEASYSCWPRRSNHSASCTTTRSCGLAAKIQCMRISSSSLPCSGTAVHARRSSSRPSR